MTMHERIDEQPLCENCGSILIPQTDVPFRLYKCIKPECGALWKKDKERGLLNVESGNEKQIDYIKKFKTIYSQNKKKFHLDFIPDISCNEIDCLGENDDEFCPRYGCPIKKLKDELIKLDLKNDFAEIKDINNTMEVKKSIKEKWDYLATASHEIRNPNVKFKIVFFYVNESNRKFVIHEPFPRNRFDTELEANEFLSDFVGKTNENSENYYISKVLVCKDKKKISNQTQSINYVDTTEQTTLDKIGKRLAEKNEYYRESAEIISQTVKEEMERIKKNPDNKETEDDVINRITKDYEDTYDEVCNLKRFSDSMNDDFLEESC